MTLSDAITTVFISSILLFTALFLNRLLNFFLRLRNFRKTMAAIPCLFPPDSPFRLLFPSKYQTFHKDWHLHSQRSIYRKLNSDIFALVCLFEYDKVFVCEPEAVMEIKVLKPREFPRDMQVFKKYAVFGRNVIATIGDEWKRHRKITMRTFSQKSMQLVHSETAKQTSQMIANWDRNTTKDGNSIIERMRDETNKLSLHVMTGAGYGYPLDWDHTAGNIPPNHELSFNDTIKATLDNIITYVVVPGYLLDLIPLKMFRETRRAFDEMGQYVLEMIDRDNHKSASLETEENILSNLVKHSVHVWKGPKDHALEDDEVIGNAYALLIAGHETTANALIYALYMLAIHPTVQEKLFQEIQDVCGDRELSFTDIPNLVYGICILYEIMRMFPVIGALPTRTEENQILLDKHFIPKNTCIGIDLVNLHRNEKYWSHDPQIFNPSRFDNRVPNETKGYDNWQTLMDGKLRVPPKGVFFGFGEGPRSCIGRRFAEIEFVTCLSMIVQKRSIGLKDGWTTQGVWDVVNASEEISLIRPASDIPLILRKRE